MIDTSQILIIAAITVMTVLITVIGIQLIFVLREVRQILKKVNTITSQLEDIGMGLSGSFSEVVGFVGGIKKLLQVIDYVSDGRKKK